MLISLRVAAAAAAAVVAVVVVAVGLVLLHNSSPSCGSFPLNWPKWSAIVLLIDSLARSSFAFLFTLFFALLFCCCVVVVVVLVFQLIRLPFTAFLKRFFR